MSVVTPGELWQESGRWEKLGGEMLTFKDKGERDLCISPTNEEAVCDIFRKTVKSYKELPLNLYQINTKFRDEIRPRFGLMRGREFTMKDAYSFDIDQKGLDASYQAMYQAYCHIFDRLELKYSVVEADAGSMGTAESQTHEFQIIADSGEDEIIYSEKSDYAANRERACTKRPPTDFNREKKDLEEVSTPSMATIEEVSSFLSIPQHHTIKSLIYLAIKGKKEEAVLVQLLGDDQLNEVKLKNFLAADHLLPATDQFLKERGIPKGYIGAVNLPSTLSIRIIFDRAVDLSASYVAGAMKADTHFKGFIPERDAANFEVADLRLAQAGDLVPEGEGVVAIKRGIEVGHIFQLGDLYSLSMGVKVLNAQGKSVAPLMGCYGIGVTRIMAAAVEQKHDSKGIVWPSEIAPFQIYFVLLAKSPELNKEGEQIYKMLAENGYQVLLDDRQYSAGFKFKDAELLGLPLTIVLGEKTFKEKNCLEVVERRSGHKHLVKIGDLLATVNKLYRAAN